MLGVLPVASTLQANRAGDKKAGPYEVPATPNLPGMALLMDGALNVLSQDPDGFFLMAEGGAIDWAGHANAFGRLIEEQHDFDLAIEAVVAWVEAHSSWDDTLLIITPGFQWNTGSHTNQVVPVFAKGKGAEKLLDAVKGTDSRRGPYIDNTDIPKTIRAVWR